MLSSLYAFLGVKNFRGMIDVLFKQRTNTAHVQFFRYIFVGGFSAGVNLVTIFIFTSSLHVHYLLSELVAFIVATIVNYVLSILWIFKRSQHFKLEFMVFTLIGVGGLGINELILWVCVSKLKLYYLLGEAIAIAIVTIWSFALRRVLFMKLADKTRG